MTTLYNLHTEGSDFRITKFVDGEVESSYICSVTECECPAGHRASCRHRQMLPDMIAHDIVNTHWFYHYDIRRVVDFNGTLKSNFDAMEALAQQTEPTAPVEKLVDSPVSKTVNPVGSNPTGGTTPWRRL